MNNNNYKLNNKFQEEEKTKTLNSLKKLFPLMKDQKSNLVFAAIAVLINSLLNLVAPVIIGYTVDNYIQTKDFHGVLIFAAILLTMYSVALFASYFQTLLMGKTGQRVLFNLRNSIFSKLQNLPIAFFNQNKIGDLISRINNDTDKLNQFFSQALVQFIANIIMIIGTGIFILYINFELGVAALIPGVLLLIFTRILSPWIKKTNASSLKNLGGLSAEISENLENFKVIVAFNRRDYFRNKFNIVNEQNYKSSLKAGIANNTLTPAYGLFSNMAQLIVVVLGIYLINQNSLTIGVLISFLIYINRFYEPLRQIASLWSNFQVAMAAWDRIYKILSLSSDLEVIKSKENNKSTSNLLEFKNVSFSYPDGKQVLENVNFKLESGKTYALVGPTGGGKTTTASLIARLFDPTKGMVIFKGKDIRTYETFEITQKIGFILQDPFLFTGNLFENIIYGNEELKTLTINELKTMIESEGLGTLLDRFDKGLETVVSSSGGTLSLGQKQLVAFIRAVLRKPELLILDEATANIDTVTEMLLQNILDKLPKSTTKVIIAHRLNTIENADEIFFVNSGNIVDAGSMEQAVDMLLHGKRKT
ncbi:MAG: ABC transporter ATP-binding protein [Candidatus Gracilibacteria bacterium]|nr:ABC transporter ATP-binding protein [Candidatus Gracilibacteria bacterium]MDD2908697.1 ABC transporter ATP-binding protein [Candidatus Gracilibacteria bacterium]